MTRFHRIAFSKADPLGDGLGDMIQAEQREPEAIILEEQFDESLASNWEAILNDVRSDPDWFHFAEDDEAVLY